MPLPSHHLTQARGRPPPQPPTPPVRTAQLGWSAHRTKRENRCFGQAIPFWGGLLCSKRSLELKVRLHPGAPRKGRYIPRRSCLAKGDLGKVEQTKTTEKTTD